MPLGTRCSGNKSRFSSSGNALGRIASSYAETYRCNMQSCMQPCPCLVVLFANQRMQCARAMKTDIESFLQVQFPLLDEESLAELLPPKAVLLTLKLSNRALAHSVDGAVLFFDPTGRKDILIPSVYALWKFPQLLPALHTYSPVSSKVGTSASSTLQGKSKWPHEVIVPAVVLFRPKLARGKRTSGWSHCHTCATIQTLSSFCETSLSCSEDIHALPQSQLTTSEKLIRLQK